MVVVVLLEYSKSATTFLLIKGVCASFSSLAVSTAFSLVVSFSDSAKKCLTGSTCKGKEQQERGESEAMTVTRSMGWGQ